MANSSSTLFFLGRRFERLLMVGTLLLALCFVALYLALAAEQFARDKTDRVLDALLSVIEADREHLHTMFGYESARSSLKKRQPPIDWTSHYGKSLERSIERAANRSGMEDKEFRKVVDPNESPETLISRLRDRKKQIDDQTISVWGIETTRAVPVQVGSTGYKVPSALLANALVIFLAPLILTWMGSAYSTRQRELALIYICTDFNEIFPHILNLLPVRFEGVETRIAKKGFWSTGRSERFLLTLTRVCVVTLFGLPMAVTYALAIVTCASTDTNADWLFIILGLVAMPVIVVQLLALLVQEVLLVSDKEFFQTRR